MKKLLIALLVLGLVAPGMAMAQNLDQRVTELENNMEEFAKQGMKLKETVIGMKKMGFHWYGSFRTHLGYYDTDEEYIGGPAMDGDIGITADDDSGTLLSLSGQSRLGAKVIANENFYGVVEMGYTEGTRDGASESPYIRLGYGVWDFGQGKLTVGKDYTPGTFLGYSKMVGDLGDQGDANMLVAGLSYIGRQPQVKLSFGDFDIALIEPHPGADDFSADATKDDYDARTFGKTYDKDFVIPRIEAAHVFRLNDNNINIRPVLGYQTYDVEYYDPILAQTEESSIDSYLAGLGVSADFKPAYVKATASYMQNAGNYGQSNIGLVSSLNLPQEPDDYDPAYLGLPAGSTTPYGPGLSILNAQLVDGSVEDSTLIQGTLVGGAKLNDMVNLEGGFGYMSAEVDLPALATATVQSASGSTAEQTAMVGYLQAWFSITDNVNIIPEFGIVDRGDLEIDGQDDIDCGSMTYFDVDFRMDF